MNWHPENPQTDEQKWKLIRAQRDEALRRCDYAMLPDAPPYTQEEVDAIADYRQALRDIPQTFSNPDDVVFPVSPI